MSYNQIEYVEAREYCSKVTDGTHDSPKKVDEGKKLITSKHLKEYSLDFDKAYLISQEDYEKVNSRSKVEQYDLLYSMIGTVGEVYLEKSPIIEYAVKNVGIFKVGNKLDSKWLYYYLKSSQAKEYLFSHLSGSTQQYITLGSLRKFPIPMVDDKIREIIVEILSSLDEKIELNNKINKNLEEMAQVLYKQWFVDFEFPNEDGEPYKSSGGEMIESELGLIPKGWEVVELSSIADIDRGLSYKGKHLCEEGTPMINLGNIKPLGGFIYKKIKFYNGEYKPRHIVKAGDIIIANTDMTAKREILGTPILVPLRYEGDIIYSHHLYAIRNIKLAKEYMFYYFKSDIFKKMAENYANGTTVLAIGKRDVQKVKVLVPKLELINNFVGFAENSLIKVELNELENSKLANTRDTLLPKLMSGEIKVPIKE